MKIDEDGLSEALTGALRRYIYYIEERDIEVDIQRKDNINQYYLVGNYSSKMPEVLKSVSFRFLSTFGSLIISHGNPCSPCVLNAKFYFKVMLSCNELLVACQWQGEAKDCAQLFTLTKSDSGYCCSFNIVDTDKQLL